MKQNFSTSNLGFLFIILLTLNFSAFYAQSNAGCVSGNFGVDAGLYANIVELGAGTPAIGSNDWFEGGTGSGRGIIDETNVTTLESLLKAAGNPLYERRMKFNLSSIQNNQILIDGLYARDYFGGTGYRDATSYNTASKNGEDPAIWDPGEANVLGKNDIIDAAGHMFRDNTTLASSNLWFVGLFNMAEPGGTAYMDFEFYVAGVSIVPRSGGGIKFTSGGPQLGHTAYDFENNPGFPGTTRIKKVGDFIFSISISGNTTTVETRIWVKKTDLLKTPSTFNWVGTFDGAYNGSLYGYAGITPITNPVEICGYINTDGTNPLGPPWGVKGTKTNSWSTTYGPNSLAEVAINLTALGMDHASLSGADPCYFPLNTFLVKTRASESFTAQLKDFAGPYSWGQPSNNAVIQGTTNLSCDNLTTVLSANPIRSDVEYAWTTVDGNITTAANLATITVDKPGTYVLSSKLPTNCPMAKTSVTVGLDATKPFFNIPPTVSSTTACNGNDGTFTATASGANKPYMFSLYKDDVFVSSFTETISASSHTFTGLVPGNYRVDVKGVYACVLTTGTVVVPAKIPVVLTPTLTHVLCNGASTGAINLNVSGGKTPLSYMWSTGNNSKDLINVMAGNYTVTVTDAAGCVTTGNYTITQPTALVASIAKTNDTNPDTVLGTGTATLTVTGGTGSYTYAWVASETGIVPSGQATNKDLTLLDYGRYTVTITDANLCTTTATVFIYEPEICNDGIDNDGDGLNNCNDPDCKPAPTSSITAGTPNVCVGQISTYSVTANAAYDSYEWTVPSNATINGVANGNSISVTWTSTAGGQICVRGKKFDCFSDAVCISVNVAAVPLQPGAILISN